MDGLCVMPLVPRGFFDWLLRRPNKKNAFIELNNLLAQASNPSEVTIEATAAIKEKYKVSISRRFRREVADIYRGHIKACLADKKLTDAEIQSLVQLKSLLGINDSEVAEIENQTKSELYGSSVDAALSDGQMTEEEYGFLQRLEKEIFLPEDLAVNIYREKGGSVLQRVFDRVTMDRRLSPAEEAEFEALSRSLHIHADHDNKTEGWLEKFRFLWRVENADMPVIEPEINLQRGEKCYLSCSAQWSESRSVVRRVNYSGPALRIKIAKGLYWRAGSYSVNAQREDVMQLIDSGTLYLTSKRLIFMGGRGNKIILLGKILDFDAFTDGVRIRKEAGKDPLIEFGADGEVFAAILGRAIKDLAL